MKTIIEQIKEELIEKLKKPMMTEELVFELDKYSKLLVKIHIGEINPEKWKEQNPKENKQ